MSANDSEYPLCQFCRLEQTRSHTFLLFLFFRWPSFQAMIKGLNCILGVVQIHCCFIPLSHFVSHSTRSPLMFPTPQSDLLWIPRDSEVPPLIGMPIERTVLPNPLAFLIDIIHKPFHTRYKGIHLLLQIIDLLLKEHNGLLLLSFLLGWATLFRVRPLILSFHALNRFWFAHTRIRQCDGTKLVSSTDGGNMFRSLHSALYVHLGFWFCSSCS